jgi:uncharacterized membrane protein
VTSALARSTRLHADLESLRERLAELRTDPEETGQRSEVIEEALVQLWDHLRDLRAERRRAGFPAASPTPGERPANGADSLLAAAPRRSRS